MSVSPVTHAMVLAAGLGTRMRPLTLTTPKPLVEVADKALIDWALDGLADAGVTHAVVNLHHLGDQIKEHLRHRARPAITFLAEDPVLETGGGVQNALPHLGRGPFFVVNADGLWIDDEEGEPALKHMAEAWDDAQMDALLLLHDPQAAFGYDGIGDFTLDPPFDSGGRLARRQNNDVHARVFTGVQLLHPRLFAFDPGGAPGGVYSLNALYDRARAAGRLFGLTHPGEWHHVGTMDALAKSDAHLRARGFGEGFGA